MAQIKGVKYHEFEDEMLNVISKHFPFSLAEIMVVYDRLKSFDKTKEMCEFAIIFSYSDLLAAFVNHKDDFAMVKQEKEEVGD